MRWTSQSTIDPKLLPDGAWLRRNNVVGSTAGRNGRYAARPFDLLQVERTDATHIYVARFDRWEGSNPVFGRHTKIGKDSIEKSRFEIATAPTPPTPIALEVAKPAALAPAQDAPTLLELFHEMQNMRDQVIFSTVKICESIDALTAAWTGRRPDPHKLNGHAPVPQ